MNAPQIKVENGWLQGKVATTHYGRKYYSFEGIPYAKPPIGKLRFMDPQEADDWVGVLDATKPGNRCAQMNPLAPKFEGSEDCLYLNVYTPHLPSEKLDKIPVIFYVYGGRLVLGYGDYYRPDYFMDKDVIVVTFNYRLTILGFLSLDIPEVPGNAGLKDTLLALKWVNRNIGNFSGNSSNVIMMGESAGAALCSAMFVTPLANGLYHKAILESGVCVSDLFMNYDHMDNNRKFCGFLGKDLKAPREIYEYLIGVPIEELLEAVCAAELSRDEINAFFLPVVEKKFEGVVPFMTDYPANLIRDNKFNKVPILAGIHSHDGALFLPYDSEGPILRTDLEFYIPNYLFVDRKSGAAKRMARDIKRFYFGKNNIGKENLKQYVDMITDVYFLRDLYISFDMFAKYNSDIYCYRFAYSGNLNTRVMKNLGLEGASHGDIMAYQFYRENKAHHIDGDDEKIIKFLSEAWTNFAKYGKPSWSGQKMGWIPYTEGERYMLNIDKELTLAVYPERDRIELWKQIMTPRSKM